MTNSSTFQDKLALYKTRSLSHKVKSSSVQKFVPKMQIKVSNHT